MIEVERPVRLDAADGQATSRFVAWLRDRLSEGLAVAWRASLDPRLDASPLYHLPPPLPEGPGEQDPALVRWRASYRPGVCFYRVGPGFIQVKDLRGPGGPSRYTLTQDPYLSLFTRCLTPTLLTDLTEDARRIADALLAERLLIAVGAPGDRWVTTLPSRMRRWPVPSYLI
ncbi:DUF5825 family protein [Sphaerisporangium corydalis]|uniref:DUF5825 family protein n=1 Tax=Sphaerisporangium corydalis TaxID=1441875 RepID=A0ABV9EH68_9ACTN|nr:DUF5825 family protein [Sphaerisporangium corydalis]